MLTPTSQHKSFGPRPAGRPEQGKAGLAATLFAALYAARAALLWLLLALGLAVLVASGWAWFSERRDNRVIAELLAGHNVEIDPDTASARVLFARAYYLLIRDRIDEAQILLDQANFRGDPKTRVLMLYNTANTRLRAVFDAIDQGQFDKATTLVQLAKEDYTQALRLDPEAWDIKYNLDVAARLVRDLPQGETIEDPANAPPKQLWTDLPGIPKGEP